MNHFNYYKQMIVQVAEALGSELLSQVVFIGGCATGLLITDDFTREQVRYTDDVDMIVHIMSYSDWAKLQKQLREKGFSHNQDGPVCGMKLGELKVDFMPDNRDILGFSNCWQRSLPWRGSIPPAQIPSIRLTLFLQRLR